MLTVGLSVRINIIVSPHFPQKNSADVWVSVWVHQSLRMYYKTLFWPHMTSQVKWCKTDHKLGLEWHNTLSMLAKQAVLQWKQTNQCWIKIIWPPYFLLFVSSVSRSLHQAVSEQREGSTLGSVQIPKRDWASRRGHMQTTAEALVMHRKWERLKQGSSRGDTWKNVDLQNEGHYYVSSNTDC